MRIIWVRRLSQVFFLILFLWFCAVTRLGERFWQLRGWPVNWLLELDPLNGLGVLLATHTIYAGLIWGVVTIMLTIVLGRFFCGWICPFGTLSQAIGYLGQLPLNLAARLARNRPQPAQRIKYWLLLFILSAAAADLLYYLAQAPYTASRFFFLLIGAAVILMMVLAAFKLIRVRWKAKAVAMGALLAFITLFGLLPDSRILLPSLQIGLLDPMALMHRSINLALWPLGNAFSNLSGSGSRFYQGAGGIGVVFLFLLLLSLRIPRFYCRFVCPTGALLGLLGRFTVWRIGKTEKRCSDCHQCEAHCEGACAPAGSIQIHECVLCLNCRDQCSDGLIAYGCGSSAAGEVTTPDLGRREVVGAAVAGLTLVPMFRAGGNLVGNWNPQLIRPPGSLDEASFLSRCIKCGQCMRICPTNVIHPALGQAGLEGLWTPVLNQRLGKSGCAPNCVACSRICPTAAIRPLTVDERMGRGQFAQDGPLRIGTAFVDRGRCLPWAMDRPCIVCQENCPVSPKAIFTRTVYQPVRDGLVIVQKVDTNALTVKAGHPALDQWASGDYYGRMDSGPPRRIRFCTTNQIWLDDRPVWPRPPESGQAVQVTILLQQPYVDPRHCIGCGVCEHECPVVGRRAIRVTAENESRHPSHRMILKPMSANG
jgi:polyferredoxin